MLFRKLWTLLVRPNMEDDPEIRAKIESLGRSGLRVIAWALIVVPIAMVLAIQLLGEALPWPAGVAELIAAIVVVGVLTIGVCHTSFGRQHPRLVGWVAVAVTAVLLVVSSILRVPEQQTFLFFINGQVAVLLLLATVSLPFRPIHVFLLGLTMQVTYYSSYLAGISVGLFAEDPSAGINLLFQFMLTVLGTALSSSLYQRTVETYHAHQQQLRATNDIRDAQCKMVLSQSAASIGRLAAALSHEFNTPLGILKSNLETIAMIANSPRELAPEKREQAGRMQSELCHDSQESVNRLKEIVARMQRLTNLDRAEILPVNLNEMIQDVATIVQDSEDTPPEIKLDLNPVPAVHVRPHFMSAVLSTLMSGGMRDYGTPGEITVSTATYGEDVQITVHDRGAEVSDSEVQQSLDPSFQVRDNRVTSCNWNLFNARQIIHQHGGEIAVRNTNGDGTLVTVTLPVKPSVSP